MRAWGSAPAVIEAIRDEAAAEIERIEREAAVALDRLRATLTDAPSIPDAEARLAAARRLAADSETDEEWQDIVAASTDRDAWIAEVADVGSAAVVAAPDTSIWTDRLASEAVGALEGDACVLVVPSLVAPSLDGGWRAALERKTGKRITLESGPLSAGCIARSCDGRVTFDNSLDARVRRAQTAWRAALAKVYDEAIAAPPQPRLQGAAMERS
jgi:vacuolar-type H+-ATPase subunit E/Vma4